jgi:glycosyltransferase involved in cell wall biosynthesis
MEWLKGSDLLIEAFRRIPEEYPAILELKGMGGDDSTRSGWEASGKSLSRVRMLPASPHEEVRTWLASLDVLVVPSRVMETGPLVVLEAFASGVPVVGARRGGIAEWVQHGVNGLLFEPESVDDLTSTLMEILKTPEMLVRLRKGIGLVRTMGDVARETEIIYQSSP